MEDAESVEPASFWNQTRFPVVKLENQPSHETFDPQPVLPRRCIGAVVTQSLWEWVTNDRTTLRATPQEGAHAPTLPHQESETR